MSALVAALFIGSRHGHKVTPMPAHNLAFTAMGAGLLWVGWFGFNAGSALGSNELASVALVNTNSAAAAAALAWMLADRARGGKTTLLSTASGAVAGLVAVTPAAGFVAPWAALIIGAAGGALCHAAVELKNRLGYDDALDVVGVHLVGGIAGALLTGVFADPRINSAIPALSLGASGGLIVEGSWALVGKQALAVVATMLFCGLGTWGLLAAINVFTPLRADEHEEHLGMDLSQHKERAYTLWHRTSPSVRQGH